MKREVTFSATSLDQLTRIYDHIANAASSAIALDFTNAITNYCESFVTFPKRGMRRDDIRPGLRIVGFRHRVAIAFAVSESEIAILGIFYGGQNYEQNFEDKA